MTGAITWDQVAYFVGLAAALLGLWYRVETRIAKSALEAKEIAELALKNVNDARTDLQEFKLHVADNYAKGSLIQEVEARVISRIDAVVAELSGMRKDFNSALMEMVKRSMNREE